jgi:phosphatidylserine decarboxylase
MLAFALALSRPHSQCNRQAWRAPIGRRAGSPVAATVAAALEELAISRTRQWISDVVIRLGLCPFAARPFQQDRIRYVVSNATTDE